MKEHSERLPQCPDTRILMSMQSQPIIDIHRSHAAVSDAKYYISGDMANVMVDGVSELEMGKNNNLPFWLARPKTARKMSRMDTSINAQYIWSMTKGNVKLK